MLPTFLGLETARRSLHAQRLALEVAGHNIANANTPGYSRQVARLAATAPWEFPGINRSTLAGHVGTGVHVKQIVRMKNDFIQHQMNVETQAQGYWETRGEILRQIELTFGEPSDVGIRSAIDLFWESLQELSQNPESLTIRTVVRERALAMADTIRATYQQLASLRDRLDSEVRSKVGEINALGAQIAAVNKEIVAALSVKDLPNDLLDRRDQLIAQLSKLTDIRVVERSGSLIAVTIGGVTLVDGFESRSIVAVDLNNDGFAELRWEGTGLEVTTRSGALHALIEGRDQEIPSYIEQLNELARTLITRVNEVHREGYGLGETFDPGQYQPFNPDGEPAPAPAGRNFFKDASDDPSYVERAAELIALADAIMTDPGNIAASRNGAVGDGDNALRLAQLKHERMYHDGKATPTDYLAAIVSGLGVDAQEAERMIEHQGVLLGHLEQLNLSVSGVSLDEEMTNLIQFQHAYAAASRLVTTLDEAIDIIINRMGLVGRG